MQATNRGQKRKLHPGEEPPSPTRSYVRRALELAPDGMSTVQPSPNLCLVPDASRAEEEEGNDNAWEPTLTLLELAMSVSDPDGTFHTARLLLEGKGGRADYAKAIALLARRATTPALCYLLARALIARAKASGEDGLDLDFVALLHSAADDAVFGSAASGLIDEMMGLGDDAVECDDLF